MSKIVAAQCLRLALLQSFVPLRGTKGEKTFQLVLDPFRSFSLPHQQISLSRRRSC
jgi:hypothetical protein